MWRATRSGQTVQVGHDDHSGLSEVYGQVVVLRQGQVAQETLIWTQRGREDLRNTAIKRKVPLRLNLKQN